MNKLVSFHSPANMPGKINTAGLCVSYSQRECLQFRINTSPSPPLRLLVYRTSVQLCSRSHTSGQKEPRTPGQTLPTQRRLGRKAVPARERLIVHVVCVLGRRDVSGDRQTLTVTFRQSGEKSEALLKPLGPPKEGSSHHPSTGQAFGQQDSGPPPFHPFQLPSPLLPGNHRTCGTLCSPTSLLPISLATRSVCGGQGLWSVLLMAKGPPAQPQNSAWPTAGTEETFAE